jgi:hypothetical protein
MKVISRAWAGLTAKRSVMEDGIVRPVAPVAVAAAAEAPEGFAFKAGTTCDTSSTSILVIVSSVHGSAAVAGTGAPTGVVESLPILAYTSTLLPG